jgi:hypothetical protein
VDIVLGVSMAPVSVQTVLLQGENADGVTLDEKEFAITAADDWPTVSASDRVIAAILGTREDTAGAGLELSSVGVACTDPFEAAALRDALTAHRLQNVMLVSAFLAATSLTQFVGGAMGYERTAMLFVEPDTATLAVVETCDGSIADLHQEQVNSASGQIAATELIQMVAGIDELPTRPDGLFVVGAGVDIASFRPQLEGATSLSVSMPEEPATALARGAALASANAPLFASSTAALAYAQDPGTGAVDVSVLPEYVSIADAEQGLHDVAYSAVTDDEASAPTVLIAAGTPGGSEARRRPGLLVGSAVAVAGFSAALALEVALTVGIHTTVGLLPAPLHNLIAPAEQLFAPAPGQVAATKAVAPKPLSPPAGAPRPAAVVPAAPVPAAPVPAAPPVPVPLVIPLIAPAPMPPVQLPDPPASPPVAHASPPTEPPPLHVPPPKSPPPHQTPPGQGTNPGGRGGGTSGNPDGGGPANCPGPSHGNPSAGGPHSGEPGSSPGPSHGTPGGAPPEGGGPVGGGGPIGEGEPHGGGGPAGGESGGGESGGGSHGAESGGGESSSGSHGGESGGGSSGGGGGAESGGGGSSGGGAEGGGGHR